MIKEHAKASQCKDYVQLNNMRCSSDVDVFEGSKDDSKMT